MILMTYDLVTNGYTEMNGFVKEYLVDKKGWRMMTRYVTNRVKEGRTMMDDDCYPSTTLTHPYRNLSSAIEDFKVACGAYDVKMGWKIGTTKGKVVCAEVENMKGYKAL